MNGLAKNLIGLLIILAIGAATASSQVKTSAKQCVAPPAATFKAISRPEVESLLEDVAKSNPRAIKALAEDPEMKRVQLQNLKELLATASQAHKEGYAKDPTNCNELENIRIESIAVIYDKEINKNRGPMPPFGFITQERVDAFWGGEAVKNGIVAKQREAEFQQFLTTKLELLKANAPDKKDRSITAEETAQAREFFAKMRIYSSDYENEASGMPAEFRKKLNLQVKLQQAQFLARQYSSKMSEKVTVSDLEVDAYIRSRPELDPTPKRAKAEKILQRVKAGEDFAKLANEFSEDPGNKNAKGQPQSGIYRNVAKGVMVAPFESAALALQPGQVAGTLVETDFGFHIIKLERKDDLTGPSPSGTYDVRHILISTGYKDGAEEGARDVPVKAYARGQLQREKESHLLGELIAANEISVPDDFTVPAAAAEPAPKKKAAPRARKRPVKKRK